jgi:hypothetical protein
VPLGRRCEAGCESWPDDPRYATCPLCAEPTTRYRNLQPLSQSEAAHRAFEAFYEERCAARGVSVDGPLPA